MSFMAASKRSPGTGGSYPQEIEAPLRGMVGPAGRQFRRPLHFPPGFAPWFVTLRPSLLRPLDARLDLRRLGLYQTTEKLAEWHRQRELGF